MRVYNRRLTRFGWNVHHSHGEEGPELEEYGKSVEPA